MKNIFRLSLIGTVLSVLVIAAAGCSTSTPAPAANQDPQVAATEASTTSQDGAVQVESYKLFQDDGSGAKGPEVTSFTAADHTQYFEVKLTGFLKPGANVKWVFTAVDTTAGKDIKITEVEFKVVVGNTLDANLKMDKDFPVGTYKAEITVDGQPLGTIDYSVTG
jgi:hypothetical protein